MLERRVRIVNHLGLHARAAAKLVRTVNELAASVKLRVDQREVDAASILDLLALAASYGTHVEIVVDGQDEETAMTRVEEMFINGFGEL